MKPIIKFNLGKKINNTVDSLFLHQIGYVGDTIYVNFKRKI